MPTTALDTLNSTGIFQGHELHPIHTGPQFREFSVMVWPLYVILGAFAILIFLKASEPRKLSRVLLSLFSLQASRQLEREDYRFSKRFSILLFLAFILILALFLSEFNRQFRLILTNHSQLEQFGFFCALLMAMYTVRVIVSSLMGFVTDARTESRDYLFNALLLLQITAVLIFPLIVLLEYANCDPLWLIYPGLALLVGMYLLRLVRGIIVAGFEQKVRIFHLFVYFCTLEILPLFVLIKFLLVNF